MMKFLISHKAVSIRWPLTFMLLGGLSLLGAGTLLASHIALQRYEHDRLIKQAHATALRVANDAILASLYGSSENASVAINTVRGNSEIEEFVIYDRSGKLIEGKPFVAHRILANHVDVSNRTVIVFEDPAALDVAAAVVVSSGGETPFDIDQSKDVSDVVGHIALRFSKQPMYDHLSNVLQIQLTMFISTGITIALLMLIALVLFLRPFLQLASEIRGVGDFGFRSGKRKSRLAEVQTLANAYCVLLEDVAQAKEHLEKANKYLEERVKTRSVELQSANDDLRSALQSKVEFLSTMSHEVRTPLFGLITGISVLQNDTIDDERKAQTLLAMRESSSYLIELVNNALDLTRSEQGELEIRVAPFSWSTLISRVDATLAGRASMKGLVYKTILDRRVEENSVGDVFRITQSIINLGGNAIKFTDSGSVVIWIHQDNNPDYVCIEIADTGTGLHEMDPETLFTPYNQGVNVVGGTGLGLTIARQIVEAMQGSVSLESRPEGGTRACIRLPLTRCKTSESSRQPKIPDNSKVAIVTNHSVDFLKNATFEVQCLTLDGLKTIDSATRLVVVEADASQHRQLRRALSPLDTPVVISNAQWSIDEKLRWLADGVVGFIESIDAKTVIKYLECQNSRQLEAMNSTRLLPGLNLLLADDNELNREMLSVQLESIGCRVDHTSDGKSTLYALHQKTYDLAIVDEQMPKMNGSEVAKRYLDLERATHTPILLLTADVNLRDALLPGVACVLEKPITTSRLADNIAALVDGTKEEAMNETPGHLSEPVLDKNVLRRTFGASYSRELVEKSLQLYKKQYRENWNSLESALSISDTDAIMGIAHRLKGSAMSLGLYRLRSLWEQVELEAQRNHADRVVHTLAVIESESMVAIAELEEQT